MKIAITSQESTPESPVDSRFGRGKYFIVYDSDADTFTPLNNEQNLQAAQGAGIQSAANVVNAGCAALVTGHCGPKAFAALSKAGVAVYTAAGGTVREAMESFKRGALKKIENADVEGHW
ncbi:MAG: NifB/NifX family molybdenum-iron cluster-binding protein [Chitinispirillaceae bacterium]|nr:NifB/NifX family molybdenum-iron cluster-binding protein [Chitinispirillaceae bacterium]